MLILSNKSLSHRQCPFITHSWMPFFWCATCCITRAVPNYNKLFPLKKSKGKIVFVAWLSYNQPVCFKHGNLSPRRFQLILQTITMIATPSMPPCKTIRTLSLQSRSPQRSIFMEVSIESFELPRWSFYLSLKLTILSKPASYIMFLESLICRSNQLKRRQRQWKLLVKSTGSNNAVKATLNPSVYGGSSVEDFFGSDRLLH